MHNMVNTSLVEKQFDGILSFYFITDLSALFTFAQGTMRLLAYYVATLQLLIVFALFLCLG